jgi:WD40 repeat protein
VALPYLSHTAAKAQTGRELRTLAGHSGYVYGVAVSPDGRRAVSASADKTLQVWDLETGGIVTTFTCDAPALCCAFADDRTIIAGDQAGRVHFLALELGDGR